MDPATNTQDLAPGAKASTGSARPSRGSNAVRYPVKLQVNITPEMNASLGRVARHYDCPEGMVGRMALKQFLLSQDAQYRQQLNAAEANERNQG